MWIVLLALMLLYPRPHVAGRAGLTRCGFSWAHEGSESPNRLVRVLASLAQDHIKLFATSCGSSSKRLIVSGLRRHLHTSLHICTCMKKRV